MFTDALRIAIPAALLAFGVAFAVLQGLVWADPLAAFDVRLADSPSPFVVGMTVLGGTLLTVVSAFGAGVMFTYLMPQRLLSAGR